MVKPKNGKRSFGCLLFLAIAFPFCALAAEKHIVYFGGGGDPPGDTTIFDESFELFAKSAQKRNWQGTYYFDGGHSESEEKAAAILKSKPQSFTSQSYKAEIARLIKDVNEGKITSKDQVMIVIDTHGEEQNQTLYHGVLAADQSVSVDDLKKLVTLTESKGIRLAVLDTSCYGGNTLRLAAKNTCVIGLSQPHRMASTADTEALARTLGNHKFKNLEEAFLHARKTSPADSQPQISTPEGGAVMSVLKSLDRALYDYEDLEQEKDALFVCHDTNPSDSMSGVLSNLKKLQSVLEVQNKNLVDAQDLKHLARLEKEIQNYSKMRKPLDDFLGKFSERLICTDDESYCLHANQIDEQESLLKKELKGPLSTDRRNKNLAKLKYISEFRKKSEFIEYKDRLSKVKDESHQLEEALESVAREERALYDRMYKKVRAQSPKSNPCRDFKL